MVLALQNSTRDASGVRLMSLDEQVLVISFFAAALRLLSWSRVEAIVRVDVEPDRKDVLRLDDSSGDSEPSVAQTELSTGRYCSASQLDMACGRR
jgi:hypothetical protein